MSVFQITLNEKEKKTPIFDIESKVVDYQILSKKPVSQLFEYKNNFIENNSPELFSSNERAKKNVLEKK